MKALINKELRLMLHPSVYIFALFGALYLVPSYPYFMTPFYSCLCIFYVFIAGRENKDLLFTMLTPSDKSSVVAARTLTAAGIELFHMLLSVPFAIVGTMINPNGGNLAGIEANPAYFGFALALLGVFNLMFVPGFYKTGSKIGVPFLKSITVYCILFALIDYLLIRIEPMKSFLDTTDSTVMLRQLPILAGGAVLFALATLLAYKRGACNLEKVDL